ncbi:MAG: efflux RND transporter periplasmic adaptor subunit [Steroidobacteraceae bacterium]
MILMQQVNRSRIFTQSWLRALMASALGCMFVLNSGCSEHSGSVAPPSGAQQEVPTGSGAISPEAARAAGIEVVAARSARIQTTLTLYGAIRPNAEREQEVRARYPGVVRSVSKRAGDAVSKGEEVLTVESNESLQVYPVRSQFTGRLLDRRANPGDGVDSSTVLMRIADLSTVWVEFSVFARDVDHVRQGMRVFIQSADEDARAESRIEYISAAGDTDTQSVTARAVIDNRDGHWVAGQFVAGQIVIGDVQAAVAVVPTALQEVQGKPVVFVRKDQRFEPRPVELGHRAQDAVEILQGLSAGELYAGRNSYLIKADLLKSETEED